MFMCCMRRRAQTSLAYLSADGMMKAVDSAKTSSKTYCTACFTNKYPVPVAGATPNSDGSDKPISTDW